MPADVAKTPQDSGLRLVAGPELSELTFQKRNTPSETNAEVGFRFDLSLTRFSKTDLGVELSLNIDNALELAAHVTYRAIFRLMSDPQDPAAEELLLRRLGARVAPSIMYPFIRETIVAVFQKALFPPMVPPIINFETVFDIDNLSVPAFHEKPTQDQ